MSASGVGRELPRFAYVDVHLAGSGYSWDLNDAVRRSLEEGGVSEYVSCRGAGGPAAGPEILANILAVVPRELASATLAWAVEKLLDKICDSIHRRTKAHVAIRSVTIRLGGYDIRLLDSSFLHDEIDGAFVGAEGLTLSKGLLQSMDELVQRESETQCHISRVTLPCLVADEGGKQRCVPGIGSEDIWLVDYSEGDKWPHAVYDSANRCFLDAEPDLEGIEEDQ